MLHASTKQTRRRLRNFISTRPSLYFPFAQPWRRDRLVSRQSDIVIDGYPRSANSFAEAAFRLSQGKELRIAHHSHAAAQVIAGVRWNVPTLVVLRDPMEAARSWLMEDKDLEAELILDEYSLFHTAIEPFRHGFVLASFEAVTTRFDKVIDAINDRFGTHFRPFGNTPEAIEAVFAYLDGISIERGVVGVAGQPYSPARPEALRREREQEKERVLRELSSPGLRRPREAADAVYRRLNSRRDL